ncbi:MAG: SPOR domain-containing protein [Spirochaetaceae bacterium]
MERYRSLIVIASIAFFVALVLGVGLFLLYPRADDGGVLAASRGEDEEFDPIEYLRAPDAEAPEFSPPDSDEEEPLIIIYGDDDDEEDDGDDREAVPDAPDEAPPREEDAPRATPATEKPDVEPAPAESPARPQPVRAAPTVTEPRRVRVTEYWIQVISSPSRDTVEQAKLRLEEERLSGRITSKSVDGRDYYRLRVGPYDDKSEASKFLDWIREINDFSGSYISEEYPLRAAN